MLSQLLATAFVTTGAAATAITQDVTSSAAINYQYDYSSLSCPSSGLSTLMTPTYGEAGAVFTVCSSITINAPMAIVRNMVIDFKSYHLWNSFVVSVSVPSNVTETPQDNYVGMPMVFTTSGLVKGSNTTSAEVLTNVNGAGVGVTGKPYLLVSWRYNDELGGFGARAEHPVVIVDLGFGSSWVLSYETYYVGLITPTIALLKNKLQTQFDAQCADLKTYIEGRWW
ncbi:hypothetical protein E0Z10_g619 [Xylaria hypoxylon]|uniref:Uncharacterized protein n=1 Tax=Xylaria hypoxylon TaxID=37992 RepID=A0A4Z0ZGT9_9PEZI|nr:hypothetical protein E0Z10_g619 [Xylaria hypoxylon]